MRANMSWREYIRWQAYKKWRYVEWARITENGEKGQVWDAW